MYPPIRPSQPARSIAWSPPGPRAPDATNGAQLERSRRHRPAATGRPGAFGTADYNATTVGAITPSTKLFKTADVKSLVLGWQTGAFANNGLVLLTTGTATGDAAYASRENGTVANRPVINVTWTIPPSDPTRVNTVSAGPLLVVEGDKINVNMVLQNTTASAVTGVTPSALTVTASGAGAYSCATLTGPSPASQTVPANGSATFTWTCTTSTAPTVPGNLAFSATASGDAGATTFASSTSQSVIVTPALTFKAQVNNPPGVNVATNQADMTLAFPSTQGSVCYVMADGFDTNDVDYLRQVDRVTGAVTPANPAAAGTQSIEGMTWSLDFTTLYAANANQFGTLNTTTGLFSAKASTIASTSDPMQGEFGAITVADVDGISFDPATGVLYGVSRREGTNTQLDVLIKIDPVTGKHINSAFGTGVDYIKIRTDLLATPLYEIDDISFDPVSGSLYAIANGTSASPSVGDRLVTLSKSTGAVTDVARITKSTGGNLDDVEGLSFFGDGALFATSGYHAATGDTNKLWYLDKDTAIATERAVLGTQLTYNDYEAVACQGGSLSTASTPSNQVETALTASIGDRVWSDVDGQGDQDSGEPGLGGIEVCATPTLGGATVCDTTDAFGAYRIYGLTNGVSYNVTLTPGHHPGRHDADHAYDVDPHGHHGRRYRRRLWYQTARHRQHRRHRLAGRQQQRQPGRRRAGPAQHHGQALHRPEQQRRHRRRRHADPDHDHRLLRRLSVQRPASRRLPGGRGSDQFGHVALRWLDDHRRGHGPDHRDHQPARCHHHHGRPGHHERRLRLQLDRLHRRHRLV